MKRKKSNKAKLSAKLELLAKKIVKLRDKNICQKCGKKVEGTNCHASHVFPVSRSKILGYDLLNMKVLCYHDHINWWHKHPIEAGKWFTDKFPSRYKYLCEKYTQARAKGKITEDWLEEKIHEYTGILKNMEAKENTLDISDLPF